MFLAQHSPRGIYRQGTQPLMTLQWKTKREIMSFPFVSTATCSTHNQSQQSQFQCLSRAAAGTRDYLYFSYAYISTISFGTMANLNGGLSAGGPNNAASKLKENTKRRVLNEPCPNHNSSKISERTRENFQTAVISRE